MRRRASTPALLVLAVMTFVALAADAPAGPLGELRLARELGATIDPADELLRLQAAGGEFVALYRAHATPESRGAVLLLHDLGDNADSNRVVRPLRTGLPAGGWHTLSLQLPTVPSSAGTAAWLAREAAIRERLQAGMAWLESRKVLNQAIVGVGDSGAIALRYAAAGPPDTLQAVLLIGSAAGADPDDADLEALAATDLPVLDLIAERDRDPVLAAAALRRRVARNKSLQGYRQIVIAGASPDFAALADSLVARVRAWLATVAAVREIPGGTAGDQRRAD